MGGQVDWFHGAAYGAVGGALIEALVFNGRVLTWQAARRQAREAKRRKLPPLRAYVDPAADAAAALSRLLLGALVGWLLHTQVTGLYAAVAAGASAPALLRQLGSLRTVQEVIQGGTAGAGERNPDPPDSVPPVSAHPPMPETSGEVGS
ncbi:hypothetical protein [Streptacidiphilus anmyonensis]|uniref:hypothetical protein n=1 Tax=Streptacidiphilus anmyonensis TaxID=405782 RepID=UPI001F204331|nr:hypothetical protein [Streptacidiphilus anmyonensis]